MLFIILTESTIGATFFLYSSIASTAPSIDTFDSTNTFCNSPTAANAPVVPIFLARLFKKSNELSFILITSSSLHFPAIITNFIFPRVFPSFHCIPTHNEQFHHFNIVSKSPSFASKKIFPLLTPAKKQRRNIFDFACICRGLRTS